MSHNIKQLRPSKKSRYKQGTVNPNSCKKLFESQRNIPIIYRSSYEKKFVEWLERTPSVTRWGSECIKIDYINQYDGQPHHYYPDYVVEMNGEMYLIEVKPFNQTIPPSPILPKDNYAWKTYITNMSKWQAAREFCKQHNMHFKIITENTISKM